MDIAHLVARRRPRDIVTTTTTASVADAVSLLADKRIGALPVLEGGHLAGIFSERDVLYRLAAQGDACLSQQVGDAMTAPPITVDPNTDFDEALALMTRRRIRHLPVIEGGAMVDFISIGDIVSARMEEVQKEATQMREYIRQA
jgi:CBS domain-containing protein